ncbi:profilin [Xylaria intraflava]|nr:profilin [Xylaria intraflava]
MSWQAYIDTSLVGSGHIDKAAIVSAAGDSVWATSAGFTIQPDELKTIVTILSGPGPAVDKAFGDGLYIAGERYVLTRAEGRSIYARHGRTGICIAKTSQAFIVAHHGEAQIAGNASSTTEGLADYLIKLKY